MPCSESEGIQPDIITLIFQRNFSGTNKSALGFGFGLYICKQLCDRYDWKIEVDRGNFKTLESYEFLGYVPQKKKVCLAPIDYNEVRLNNLKASPRIRLQ